MADDLILQQEQQKQQLDEIVRLQRQLDQHLQRQQRSQSNSHQQQPSESANALFVNKAAMDIGQHGQQMSTAVPSPATATAFFPTPLSPTLATFAATPPALIDLAEQQRRLLELQRQHRQFQQQQQQHQQMMSGDASSLLFNQLALFATNGDIGKQLNDAAANLPSPSPLTTGTFAPSPFMPVQQKQQIHLAGTEGGGFGCGYKPADSPLLSPAAAFLGGMDQQSLKQAALLAMANTAATTTPMFGQQLQMFNTFSLPENTAKAELTTLTTKTVDRGGATISNNSRASPLEERRKRSWTPLEQQQHKKKNTGEEDKARRDNQQKHQHVHGLQHTLPSSSAINNTGNNRATDNATTEANHSSAEDEQSSTGIQKRRVPVYQITPQQLHLAMQHFFRMQQEQQQQQKDHDAGEGKESAKCEIGVQADGAEEQQQSQGNGLETKLMQQSQSGAAESQQQMQEEDIIVVEEENEEGDNGNGGAAKDPMATEVQQEQQVVDDCYVDVVGEGAQGRSSQLKMQRKAHIDFYRKLKSLRNRGATLDCQFCLSKVPNTDSSVRSHVHSHCKTALFVCKLCQRGFQDQHLVFEHIGREHPAWKGTQFIEDRRDMSILMDLLNDCFPRVLCRARESLFDAIERLCLANREEGKGNLQCQLCSASVSPQRDAVYGHLNTHPAFKCKKCKFSCAEEQNQLEHQLREHPLSATAGLDSTAQSTEKAYCVSLAFEVLFDTLRCCFGTIQSPSLSSRNGTTTTSCASKGASSKSQKQSTSAGPKRKKGTMDKETGGGGDRAKKCSKRRGGRRKKVDEEEEEEGECSWSEAE